MEDMEGRELTPWRDLGAGSEPTCSKPHSRARTIPKAIHEVVGELKVRFQHGSGGDPEGFQARAGFLALDLIDAPPALLRTAVAAWVREQPFMPTAADLTRLMRDELERRDRAAGPAPTETIDFREKVRRAQAFCDQRNPFIERNKSAKPPDQVEWFVTPRGEPALRWIPTDPPAALDRVNPRDVDRLNRALRKFGAPFRYDRRGYDLDLPPGFADPTDPVNGLAHP